MAGRLASALMLACACASFVEAAPLPDSVALRAIDTRLNKTGKPLNLPTVVREGPETLGEVLVTVAGDDTVAVDRDGLLAVLTPRVHPQIVAAIGSMDTTVPLASLGSLQGLSLVFDRTSLELVLAVSADTAKDETVSLRPPVARAVPTPPAALSGYVNITSLLNHTWESPLQSGHTGMSFQFDGATRLFGMVLEGEAAWDGPLDSFICPVEAQCFYQHETGFKRRGTRLVSDLPDYNTRVAFGDVSYWGEGLQHGGDLLGVSIRHEARVFNVNHRLDSATSSTLALDAPADVEILVNGVPIQRIRLKAGTYRLTDLPLTTGSNDVELIINADNGERRVVRVKALNHDTLLAPGKTEWTLAAGVPSFERDHAREYATDDIIANGRLRLGLTHRLTGHAHAQSDTHAFMGGAGLLYLSPFGLWGLSAAGSFSSDSGTSGYAATASWEHLLPPTATAGRQVLRAEANYRSPFFLAPGEVLIARTGVLYPTFIPILRLSSSWTIEWPTFTSTLSARYAFANPDTVIPGAVQTDVDRWGASLSLSMPLSPTVSGTLWTGYGNERLLAFDQARDAAPEFQIGVRLSWRTPAGTSVSAETDSLLRQSVLSATTRTGTETNLLTTSVNASEAERRGSSLSATAAHHGRFADTVVGHAVNARDVGEVDSQYSSLRSTTSIAFADGQVGIGPAIRDAFVLVRPHPSLADSEVIVGDLERPSATGSRVMPAMLPAVPSYAETRLQFDATNIPTGYSLGTGAISLQPPYKAGYAVELGSDSPLSAFGTLLDERGRPVALASGVVTPANAPSPKLPVFTNSAGRFAIEGLSEGPWLITLDTADGHLLYALPVTKGADALINAGTLTPSVTVEKDHAPPSRHADLGSPGGRN